MGRHEQRRGVPGRQPGSGTAAGKTRTELPTGQGTEPSEPRGGRQRARAEGQGHEEGGSPWARGTRRTSAAGPGQRRTPTPGERPRTCLRGPRGTRSGRARRSPGDPAGPPGPDPPRGASLLPLSLPPPARPVIPRPPHLPAAAPQPAAASAAACASAAAAAAAAASLLRPSPGGAAASRRRRRCRRRQSRTPQNGGTSGTYHRRGGPTRRGEGGSGERTTAVPPAARS